MTIKPSVRINEFGVYAYRPDLADALVGNIVEIRDWYGEARAKVTDVQIGIKGYPCSVSLELEDGRTISAFSLHTVREIEVLGHEWKSIREDWEMSR